MIHETHSVVIGKGDGVKVKELIEILSKLNQDENIYIIDKESGFPYDPGENIVYDKEYNGYTL
jgi:hypothetical protein